MNWAIIKYDTGRHHAVLNNLSRTFHAIIPVVQDSINTGENTRKIWKPAIPNLVFVQCEDYRRLRAAVERLNYLQEVWVSDGHLDLIPDTIFQAFMDRLEGRVKKTKKQRNPRVVEMTELDWFNLYAREFGVNEAIKRMGKDLREKAAA